MSRRPLVLFAALPVVLAAWNGWLNDDAYILLRTVENFVNGHGLRFNLADRVQTFTCPAWTLLLAAPIALTGETYFTTLAVSLTVSAAAAIALWRAPLAVEGKVLALLGLAISQAYIDYSTSGLEGPLSHLLLVLFFVEYLARPIHPRRALHLALLAALGMLNRMDLALLFAPALAEELARGRSRATVGQLAAGFLPFVVWEVFSVVYYGFPFPNTAYAKLSNDVPAAELFARGLSYLWVSTRWDPIPALMIAAAVGVAFRLRMRPHFAAAVGALLYVFYTARIGGDFMVGRFLTPPLVAAAVVVASAPWGGVAWRASLAALGVLAIPGAPGSFVRDLTHSDLLSWRAPIGRHGIEDERIYYFEAASLRRMLRSDRTPVQMKWRQDGEEDARTYPAGAVLLVESIGIRAYFAGPKLHYIDTYALADPLLARLTPRHETDWRIGHLERDPPAGYLETLRTGVNQIEDPRIAKLSDRLAVITRGPLWNARRWKAILELNLTDRPDAAQD